MKEQGGDAGDTPPLAALLGVATGYQLSKCLYVAAALGVADALAKGPLTVEDLAEEVGAHAVSLRRLLRALVSAGVFAGDQTGRFRLSPLAEFLRSDHPQSQRDFLMMTMAPWNWSTWNALLHGVRTGENPFRHTHGMGGFEYLQKHPDEEIGFARAMRSISTGQNELIAGAYPFGDLITLVDVGGAHGHMLSTILKAHTKLKGILFDQPQMVAAPEARGFIEAPELAGRGKIAGGSFFESVPQGADGYIMKNILHDWDDEKAIHILTKCRDAMAENGRVIVVETVLKDGNEPDPGKLMDVDMMVGPGGKERTETEFLDLFQRAGLKLTRIIPTGFMVSVIESVKA